MSIRYFLTVTFMVVSSSAFSADYVVTDGGDLSAAITAANNASGSDVYEIEILGNSIGGGSLQRSVSLLGQSNATVSGALSFSGADYSSILNNISFTVGSETAVTNGVPREEPGQNLILDGVQINSVDIYGTGGAIMNTGTLTIQNGSSFANNHASNGGVLYNGSGSKALNISQSTFTSNRSTDSGGAIYNGNGPMTIKNSLFDSNVATAGYGGAIYTLDKTNIEKTTFNKSKAFEGGAIHVSSNTAELTISDSTFTGNYTVLNAQGASNYGGAINTIGKINITGTSFENNYATAAGAIKLNTSFDENIIKNSAFTGNYAVYDNGGAIVQNNGSLQIDGTNFIGNYVQNGNGGAIYTTDNLMITGDSKFSGNSAYRGGGAISASGSAELIVTDAAFSDNKTSTGNGGAIQIYSGTNLSLNNVDFSENRADSGQGGALYTAGTVTLRAVDFSGNTAQYGGAIMNNGDMTIGGGASFVNNQAEAGGAIFTLGTLNLNTQDGDILFSGNTFTDTQEGGADIYLNASGTVHVNIEGDQNTLSMDGGFAGTGFIDKTGANTLVFKEITDNTFFLGTYTQTNGLTQVFADNFFAGQNNITNGSVLHFAKEAFVDHLNVQTGGRIDLRQTDQFKPNTLTVNDFISDGTAVVMMQTDGTDSDLLKIAGTATGIVTLDMNAVGNKPTRTQIEVVHVADASSDAVFKLTDDTLDIGAHEYELSQETDTNWYLKTDGDLTKSAKTVQNLPAMHLSIVNAGLNELRKRMGDLRSSNPNAPAGTWMRGYAKHLRVHEKIGAKMDLVGVEGGVDVMMHALAGRIYLGMMGGYLYADNIHVLQSENPDAKGNTKAPTAGIYATWIGDKSNWFVDLTARHFWIQTDLNRIIRNDEINGYDVKRRFWAVTAETGRLFDFKAPSFMDIGSTHASMIAVEPKAEVRYIHGNSKNFIMALGENAFVDTTHSLTTHLNVQTSFLPNGLQSVWKPFIELGAYYEWMGKTKIKYADTNLTSSDLGGFGVETSVGLNANLWENAYLYGAFTWETGKAYTSYLLNAGVRVSF